MTTTLWSGTAESPSTSTHNNPAQRLRTTTAAVKVSLRWFGIRKTLTQEQKSQAAEPFGAEGKFLSANKKLLDTRHPAYKEVTAIRGCILSHWKNATLPYPEPGIRLIRQSEVEAFNNQMQIFQERLQVAVAQLDRHYNELKSAAQHRLGSLFNPDDYPASLEGMFALEVQFPSIEPPDYLLQLSPEIYEQERSRVSARFEEAVQLAEQAFMEQFGKLLAHLTERLSDDEVSGEKKIFRDSAISNLTEFFQRFKQLNVSSNDQLDDLVSQAQQLIRGVQPQELRTNQALRQEISTQLSRVESVLDGLLIDRPRRRIIRANPSTNGNGASHDADGH